MNYFISDIHFGHENVLTYSNRPYSSIDEMNESIIKNWNNAIKQDDKVYFLGDFAFLNLEKSKEILSRLHGYKIIILGNHDRSATSMIKMGFDEAHNSLNIKIKDKEVLLSHYPYVDGDLKHLAKRRPNLILFKDNSKELESPIETTWESSKNYLLKNLDRTINPSDPNLNYLKKSISMHIGTRLINEGKILLHGHSHSSKKRVANMINLSVEAWNYSPATEEDIYNLILDYENEVLGNTLNATNFRDPDFRPYISNKDVEDFKSIYELISTYADDHSLRYVPKNYSKKWYDLNIKLKRFVPKNELIAESFYEGHCRNARWAFYDGDKFVYIRSKFGSEFLEPIKCIENDNGFDVFIPYKKYNPSKEELDLWYRLNKQEKT